MTHQESAFNNKPKYWTDDLVSGNSIIDNQHEELLRRFEMLEDAIQDNKGYQEVKGLVAFLQRYVLTHFNTEEQDMLQYDYPRFGEHLKQHDLCKNRIFQFKKFVETESDKDKVLNVALSMVGLWVRDHILNHDLQYIHYTREKVKTKKIINVNYHWTPQSSILWSNDYLVGVDNIDEQHQKLAKWTEYLLTVNEISAKEHQKIFDFIQGFIYTHFTDEELFLIDIDYPYLEHHTLQHCQVRNDFMALQDKYAEAIFDDEIKNAVLDLFRSYMVHISGPDMEYKHYYESCSRN
ncbi:hemerythrin domain-containing protein [bacterium]|nr:hemerythrin domain-containing protein [bacterium]